MKGWITAALVVTFLSGGATGYLVGTPKPTKSWKENNLEALEERVPEISREDLDRARRIYDEWEVKMRALRSDADRLLRDQLDYLSNDTKRQIQEIIDSYQSPAGQHR